MGGARRYRKPLRKFRWCDVKAILAESFSEWNKHNAPRLGAALSYYTLLSLAPLLLVIVSVTGLVMGRASAVNGVIQQIGNLIGPEAARAAQALLQNPHSAAHGVLGAVLGVGTLLFGASAVMVELRDSLNTVWDIPPPESAGLKKISAFIKERLFSFALVLAVGFLLVVSLAISAWISALGAFSASFVPAHEVLLHVANFIVSFVIVSTLFAAIYKFLPYVTPEWKEALVGGAVTSVLFTTGKLLLGIYLGKATFASAYGAAASFVILIVWVYYSAQIFFLGAELTKAFANRHGSQPSKHPEGMVVPADRAGECPDAHVVTPGKDERC